ncbi:uncharacterized protein cd5 isoform 2-T2 [Aulostomus maculatus]
MDLMILVTMVVLLLTADDSDEAEMTSNTTGLPPDILTNTSGCPCPTAVPTSSPAPAPVPGLITVTWTRQCEGDVLLFLHHPSSSSLRCHSNSTNIQTLLRNVCENKKGCRGSPHWREEGDSNTCRTLSVHCEDELVTDVQGQHQVYKVMTALLACGMVVIVVTRFYRPTIKALQKRLSDRRQNRWIGPTQSHSGQSRCPSPLILDLLHLPAVSYHRGKSAVKNSDGEKSSSYPALEHLAVSEPSSNRNSDYNY